MSEENRESSRQQMILKTAIGLSIVSALFSCVLAALLVINHIQIKKFDPLNSPVITKLILDLKKNPQNNALREQIREMDLLARKAFFTSQTQVRTGGALLLVGVIIMLISLSIIAVITKKPPHPEKTCPGMDSPFLNAALARQLMIGAGIFLVAVVIFLSLTSETDLTEAIVSEAGNAKKPVGQIPGKVPYKLPTREELKKNWPNFRGLDGNGITKRKGVPIEWDGKSGKNILWKTKVAKPGFSSPIVWGNKVFLSGGDKRIRRVMAYDTETGNLQWQKDVCGIPGSPSTPPEVAEDTGYAAATMATDGNRVFAIFATGDLISFTLDGEKPWGKNLGVPSNHYGHSSSLITYKDLLIVQFDHSSGTALIAFDSETGKQKWKTERKADISWASPIIVNTGNRVEIILGTSSLVGSYSPENGKELWSFNCMVGEFAPSPAYSNGVVYFANDNASAVAVETATGKKKWENEDIDLPDVASPIATDQYLFIATSTGLLVTLDAKTGKLAWDKECDTGFYSSPILVGENIYVTDIKGVTYIYKASDKYEEVAKCKLGETVVATPAFVGKRIYVRAGKHLYCIGEK